MKNLIIKNKIYIIAFISLLTIFISYSYITNLIQVEKAKQAILTQELEANKELIFYNNASIQTKEKIITVNTELEILNKILASAKTYDECIENQLERLANNKIVDLEYCEKFSEEIEEIEKETILPKPVKSYNVKTDLEVNKEIYFLCKEVGASDPERCAAYWTLVYSYESWNGTSRRCVEDNNCFWIKNPTDKKGLKWNYKIGTWRHLIFETKEAWSYAFAYYYSTYHNHRNAEGFVKRWTGWNNERYIAFITQNYNNIYNKYKNFLDFAS